MSDADFLTLTDGRNLLVLATAPDASSLGRMRLIAQACRRGRPPYMVILTDGSSLDRGAIDLTVEARAAMRQAEARRALGRLGVPSDWVLTLGLHDGRVPSAGPVFDAVVRTLDFLLWRRDCTLIVVADSVETTSGSTADVAGCRAIASGVAAVSGVGLLHCPVDGGVG